MPTRTTLCRLSMEGVGAHGPELLGVGEEMAPGTSREQTGGSGGQGGVGVVCPTRAVVQKADAAVIVGCDGEGLARMAHHLVDLVASCWEGGVRGAGVRPRGPGPLGPPRSPPQSTRPHCPQLQ